MKVFLAIVIVFILGYVLWANNIININAAEIYVEDIDMKVIYYYDNDDDEFVGYNERALIQYKDSDISLNQDYNKKLDALAYRYSMCSIDLALPNILVHSVHSDAILDICLHQSELEILKKKGSAYFTDTIYFEYNSKLDVYRNFQDSTTLYQREPRSFRFNAEFVINGIYDDDFLEFQIGQIILLKLREVIYNYLFGYHRINAYHGWIIRLLYPILR